MLHRFDAPIPASSTPLPSPSLKYIRIAIYVIDMRIVVVDVVVVFASSGASQVVTSKSAYCRHCFEVTKQKKCSIRGWHCSQLAGCGGSSLLGFSSL